MTSMLLKMDEAHNPLDIAELIVMDRDWVFDRTAESELIPIENCIWHSSSH